MIVNIKLSITQVSLMVSMLPLPLIVWKQYYVNGEVEGV